MVYDDYMYIFGGEGKSSMLNDIYRLNLKGDIHQWEEIITGGLTPPPRASHTATIMGDSMYIFGGSDTHNDYFLDINLFQNIQYHCNYDGEDEWSDSLCTNGHPKNKIFDDLWEFSFKTFTWHNYVRTNSWPPPCSGHIVLPYNNGKFKTNLCVLKKLQ